MITDGLSRLRRLRSWTPASKQDLEAWQAEALELIRLMVDAPICEEGTPEIVIHYLNDADIRFRDGRYAAAQNAALEVALLEMQSRNSSS